MINTDKSVVIEEISGVDCDNTLKLEDLEINSEKSTYTENQILTVKEKTNHGLEDEQQEPQSVKGEMPAAEMLEGTIEKTISTGDNENGEPPVSQDSGKPFSFLTTVPKEFESGEQATSTGNSIEMSESKEKESSSLPIGSKYAFSFLSGPSESPNPVSNPFKAASNEASAFGKASGFGTSPFAISAKATVNPFGVGSGAKSAESNPTTSFAASPFTIAEKSAINPFGAGTDLKKTGDNETSAGSGGSTTFSFLKPNTDNSGSIAFTKPKPELGLFRNTEPTNSESEAPDPSSDSEKDSSSDPDGFEEYLKQPIQTSSIGKIVTEVGPKEDSVELGKIESITLSKDQSSNSAGEKKDEKVELQPKDSLKSAEGKLTFSFASNNRSTNINQKVSIESTSSSSNSANNSAASGKLTQNNLFSSPNSHLTEISAKNAANPFFKPVEPKTEADKRTEVKLDTKIPGATPTSGTDSALGMQRKTTNQFSSFTNAPSIFSVNVKSTETPTPAAGISLDGMPKKHEEAIAPKTSPFTIPSQTPKTDLNGNFPTLTISSSSVGAKASPSFDISNSGSAISKPKESSKTVLESSPVVNTQPDIPYEVTPLSTFNFLFLSIEKELVLVSYIY